jgi:CBS domain-containing protein
MPQYPLFINYYAKNALIYKPPLNAFGQLKTERQDGTRTLNLKEALRPIEIFSRIYALKHGINNANTVKRLKEIKKKAEISEEFYKETVYIFYKIWGLRFFNQIVKYSGLHKVNDDLDIEELNALEVEHLKQVISRLSMLRKKIRFDFSESVSTDR